MENDIADRIFAQLREDPAKTPLDSRLFEEATILLPSYLQGTPEKVSGRKLLMRHLASDLTETRRPDNTPIANLLIALFDGWTWQQVCDFGTSNVPYKDGLAVGPGMASFNRLMICLLKKATGNPSDAAHAASMLETMQALVRLWLATPETGIAQQAGDLLFDLLKVDLPRPQYPSLAQIPLGGQGLVWKRVFGDRDVYNVFFECCDLKNGLVALSKNQKTIAQARLMDWLPKVGALSWTTVTRSHHKEVEDRYGVKGGLLDFTALHMVDYKDDVLMHQCLINFYSELLSATAKLDTHTMFQHDSVGLQYMIMHGLHARTAAIYLQLQRVDPVETVFLYGSCANYLATYANEYPKHFLASQMPAQINVRLLQALTQSPGRWAHSESPKHDLHLLASLPGKALLPFTNSPLALLPSKVTNPDVLNTLATIFHGPMQVPLTFPADAPLRANAPNEQVVEEAAAARALYYHYLAHNPRFWQDIITHADTVALKDLALAALNCLSAVITANWATQAPQQAGAALPPSAAAFAMPESGHLAILSPPALEYTLPYLLAPAQSFANLVGGRGDTESAAYQVAVAKFGALRALQSRLVSEVERQPGEGYEEILATVSKKIAAGPGAREGEVGGRVATLEL